jgi:ACS family allantoate permease-like MFS transporter
LIACGWAGDKYGYRVLISMIGLCTAMLGMILIVALPLSSNSGRLAGYYLTQASPTPFVALLSLLSSNVAGYTKKTTVAAMYLIGYCVGNIIGKLSSIFGYLLVSNTSQARKRFVLVMHHATSPPR